jgi:hypothetical protein
MRADGVILAEVLELVVETPVDCSIADAELVVADCPVFEFSPDCDESADGAGVIDASGDEVTSLGPLAYLSASARFRHGIIIKQKHIKDRM